MRGATAVSLSNDEWEKFQSTPLMRGATGRARGRLPAPYVSIHAPHARGDGTSGGSATTPASFNPRPSCEGRRALKTLNDQTGLFQSTPLMRGATSSPGTWREPRAVSIHAPHARGDPATSVGRAFPRCFNPRPSCEGRRGYKGRRYRERVSIHAPHARGDAFQGDRPFDAQVSIHAPHARGDVRVNPAAPKILVSIHAPHARGDSIAIHKRLHKPRFNPRPSCEGRPGPAGWPGRSPRFNPRPSCEGRLASALTTMPP